MAEDGCTNDNDCDPSERCQANSIGIKECQNICLIPNICGKNALCRATSHNRVCECPKGNNSYE